jgi:uncharacterized damage-inducible protein DinB
MNLEFIRTLYAYNGWANQKMIAGCETVSDEKFVSQVGGSFGSLRNTVAHIMDVEWLYLERWHGRSPTSFSKADNYANLADIKARWAQINGGIDQFLGGLTQQALIGDIEFRNIKGNLYRHPLWQMMQHVVNHGTYHRGQTATLLRQLGGTPQAGDILVFYRERAGQPKP